jgi:hypothetical protein
MKDHFVDLPWLFCKTNFFPLILFRSELRNGLFRVPRNALGMSTFFRGITESIPSLFRGIFSERNSVANPTPDWMGTGQLCPLRRYHNIFFKGRETR